MSTSAELRHLDESKLARLEQILGHHFRTPALAAEALTHASMRSESLQPNERLEHLGDAVIDLVIAEHLYRDRADLAEGELTVLKSGVVRDTSLSAAFRQLGLEEFLCAEASLLPPRRSTPDSIMEGALEALAGALYLDGGLEVARVFVMKALMPTIEVMAGRGGRDNFKAMLLHIAQTRLGNLPSYRVAGESGPDHDKIFEVIAVAGARELGTGRGASKKAAEQEAARASLALLCESGEIDLGCEADPELGRLFGPWTPPR